MVGLTQIFKNVFWTHQNKFATSLIYSSALFQAWVWKNGAFTMYLQNISTCVFIDKLLFLLLLTAFNNSIDLIDLIFGV